MRRIHRQAVLGQVAQSRFAAEVLADSPLIYWKLDEGGAAASFADASGHSLPGTPSGAVSPGRPPVFGSAGGSLLCTGGIVSTSSDPFSGSLTSWSIECMFKALSLTAEVCLLGRGQNSPTFTAGLRVETNGQLQWLIVEDSATLSFCNTPVGAIAVGVPYHVVASWNSSTHGMSMTVNGGTPITSTSTGSVLHNPVIAPHLMVGSTVLTNAGSNALISNVAMYSGVLSAARIAAHFAARG